MPITFCNLKHYDAYRIIQELRIPNGLEKYISFSLHNEFIVSFQFSSSPLDSLLNNLGIADFKYLVGQEFDRDVLKLVNLKGFYPYKYVFRFGKFKKKIA